MRLYSDKTPEGVARYENVQELLNALQGFVENPLNEEAQSLSDFLIDVALLTDADNDDDDDNKVNLMTVHAAKGLEFKHVHIVGLEEQLFPSQMAMESRAELEEERRLFYVALTRAEVTCTLSYALDALQVGTGDARRPEPVPGRNRRGLHHPATKCPDLSRPCGLCAGPFAVSPNADGIGAAVVWALGQQS